MPFISAVIVAGGSSERMGGIDKIFLNIAGKTVLERTVEIFETNDNINEIVIVTKQENSDNVTELCKKYKKITAVAIGGATRAQSVQNGVKFCSKDSEYYAIHDVARPFASNELVNRVIHCAMEYGAAAPGIRVVDTIKEIDDDAMITNTPNRNSLRAISTPQIFEAMLYRSAMKGQTDAFDDCQLLERIGRKVCVVEGEKTNIKITTPEDIMQARMIAGESKMRIGHGYDVHKLVENRKLILGGVEIPYEKGLLGHSDADVLVHAVMDALLGAAALGDIGLHFPDTDPKYKDADSLRLLQFVVKLIEQNGYTIGNIDATILCQAPKLRPYIEEMQCNIANASGCNKEKINVKATTEEGLGFTGNKSGIAVHAVAIIEQRI